MADEEPATLDTLLAEIRALRAMVDQLWTLAAPYVDNSAARFRVGRAMRDAIRKDRPEPLPERKRA